MFPQERCTDTLADLALSRPDLRELALLAMVAVGRGGQGDVGQRIRDEILTVQSRNNAKVTTQPPSQRIAGSSTMQTFMGSGQQRERLAVLERVLEADTLERP